MTSPPESCYGLWYYPEINRFKDEDDTIVHDVTKLLNVWQLQGWKKTKQNGMLRDRKGNWIELYYVVPERKCTHKCESCKNKCDVYFLWYEWEQEIKEIKKEGFYNEC